METLREIAYVDLFGRPLIFYLGIITYALLLATVILQVIRIRLRLSRIPRGLHHSLGLAALGVATVHGLLSISVYF